MRTYVDIYFSAAGASPMKVAEALKKEVGLSFVFGEHDFVINWQTTEELFEIIHRMNEVLRPMGVYFRFESHEEQEEEPELREFSWPPMLPSSPGER
ncbi:MAG: hypothetical protein KGJ23_03095 [Euryarchaeota archaeon]|nr:hypothetical protein [Euryarchaeota archaeon]MDE1835585.1 hypothetical protein [Euryarchaeota archaeon]MDE1878933.1 hypothetical protein [Euryarchaeota archaeon]MDE2043793.1 hypothetical protein [Thermoplasmata archaeon]